MNPLTKIEEWYEKRHWIWKAILWIIGVTYLFTTMMIVIGVFIMKIPMGIEKAVGFFPILIILIVLGFILQIPLYVLFIRVFNAWDERRRYVRKLEEREKAIAWELEDQLKKLKEQLDRGVITQEEHEQKRKDLQTEYEQKT